MRPSEVSDLLGSISPDLDRDDWWQLGAAIKTELGESGFSLFDDWSSRGERYKPIDCKATWRSLEAGKFSAGTIYHLAGKVPPKRLLKPRVMAGVDPAAWAKKLWDAGVEAADHPYLKKKGVASYGLRVGGFSHPGMDKDLCPDALLIPVWDAGGALQGMQAIYPKPDRDGKTKVFLKGAGTMSGGWYGFGESSTVVIAEGYAKVAAIHRATGYRAVVGFSAGNLPKVARMVGGWDGVTRVIVCADRGADGEKFGEKAAKAAKAVGAELRYPPTEGLDWDECADADVVELLKLVEVKVEVEVDHEADAYLESETRVSAESLEGMQFLGFDHGEYFFYGAGTRQVVNFTAASLTPRNLMSINSLEFWERNYPNKETGCNWDEAANAVMRKSEGIGPYQSMRIRGRGAWHDKGRVVYHAGKQLVVDGVAQDLSLADSDYIYEQAPQIPPPVGNPLSNAEANKLVQLCQMLNWDRPQNGILLAGWVVIAPICGALDWRPHIWVCGKSGAGKSWMMSHIVATMTGRMGLRVKGEQTTEAGIRQYLKSDAMPVEFDEADFKEDPKRIQTILGLARQASSEDSAMVLKGSSSGKAGEYRVRSAFCFASVVFPAKHAADGNRITMLSMNAQDTMSKQERAEKFKQIEDKQESFICPEYAERMHARTLQLVPVIRHNAKVFAKAGAGLLGTQRLGDQIGTIMAGAYSLYSNKKVTPEQADEWLRKFEWEREGEVATDTDERRLLDHLLETMLDDHSSEPRSKASVASLIRQVVEGFQENDSPHIRAKKSILADFGVKVKSSDTLLISNTNSHIADRLKNTPYPTNWGEVLKRLPGAHASKVVERIGSGSPQRCASIPMSLAISHNPAKEDHHNDDYE